MSIWDFGAPSVQKEPTVPQKESRWTPCFPCQVTSLELMRPGLCFSPVSIVKLVSMMGHVNTDTQVYKTSLSCLARLINEVEQCSLGNTLSYITYRCRVLTLYREQFLLGRQAYMCGMCSNHDNHIDHGRWPRSLPGLHSVQGRYLSSHIARSHCS